MKQEKSKAISVSIPYLDHLVDIAFFAKIKPIDVLDKEEKTFLPL